MSSNQPKMECRRIRKPIMEKKRRARINDSLESLKQMLLQNTISVPQGSRPTKLEKADILEMTVRYMQLLQNKLGVNEESSRVVKRPLENHPISTFGRIMDRIDAAKVVPDQKPVRVMDNNYNIHLNTKSYNWKNQSNKENETNSSENEMMTLDQHWRPW